MTDKLAAPDDRLAAFKLRYKKYYDQLERLEKANNELIALIEEKKKEEMEVEG